MRGKGRPLQGSHIETKMSETLNKGHRIKWENGREGQSDEVRDTNKTVWEGIVEYPFWSPEMCSLAWGCFVSFHQSLKTTVTCVWKHSGPQHLTGDMEHGKFTRLMTGLLSDAMCSENLNRKHAWPCKAWRYVRAPFVGQLGECCPLCWVTLPTLSFRQLSQIGRGGGTHCSQMEVNLELTSC